MSAFGFLVVIVAIWLILNADKLAWVQLGVLRLNTKGYEGRSKDEENAPNNPNET